MTWGLVVKHILQEGTQTFDDFLESNADNPEYAAMLEGKREFYASLSSTPVSWGKGHSTFPKSSFDPTKYSRRYREDADNPNIYYHDWAMPEFGILPELNLQNDYRKIQALFQAMRIHYSHKDLPEGVFEFDAAARSSPISQYRYGMTKYAAETGQQVSITELKNHDF